MSSPLRDQLEKALAEFRQKRADLKGMQARMAEMSSTASAPRNVVTATVDAHGQVTGVSFPTNAYKNMAPAELGNIVCETVRKAQTMARKQLTELMEPMMPEGMSMRDREPGKIDIDRLFPENPEEGSIFRGLNETGEWNAR